MLCQSSGRSGVYVAGSPSTRSATKDASNNRDPIDLVVRAVRLLYFQNRAMNEDRA